MVARRRRLARRSASRSPGAPRAARRGPPAPPSAAAPPGATPAARCDGSSRPAGAWPWAAPPRASAAARGRVRRESRRWRSLRSLPVALRLPVAGRSSPPRAVRAVPSRRPSAAIIASRAAPSRAGPRPVATRPSRRGRRSSRVRRGQGRGDERLLRGAGPSSSRRSGSWRAPLVGTTPVISMPSTKNSASTFSTSPTLALAGISEAATVPRGALAPAARHVQVPSSRELVSSMSILRGMGTWLR